MDFQTWWTRWLSLKKLHQKYPGGRGEAEKQWAKVVDKTFEGTKWTPQWIYDKTDALARYDLKRLQKGEYVDRWPYGIRFLNPDKGYLSRDVGSFSELVGEGRGKVISEDRKCACGHPVLGPAFDTCGSCYLPDTQQPGIRTPERKTNGLEGFRSIMNRINRA